MLCLFTHHRVTVRQYQNRIPFVGLTRQQGSAVSGQKHSLRIRHRPIIPLYLLRSFAQPTKTLVMEEDDTMVESGNTGSTNSQIIAQNWGSTADGILQLSGLSLATPDELYDDLSETEEYMSVTNISDEDASSLIEPSISRSATRLRAPNTPAVEKAAALEEGGGYFDEGPETPPAEVMEFEGSLTSSTPKFTASATGSEKSMVESSTGHNGTMSLGNLPSPKLQDPSLPITPWLAGPKQIQIQPQGSLQGVFNGRTRSSSGGAEALRKLLPKNLQFMSSMAQVGNLFGSSNSSQKSRFGSTFPREPAHSPGRSATSSGSGSSPKEGGPPRRFESIIPSHPTRQGTVHGRPNNLRRVTSDDSLLYHSLSRTSSLGDDTRFENHHEQVNSRVKAIRDTLQDRSSFRMPQMPSLPSMPRVPSFGFNMNFLYTNNAPARGRSNTDSGLDILPGSLTKKKSTAALDPAVGPGMVGAAVSRPDAVTESAKPVIDGPNTDFLDRAIENLTGDIVIMGGYRGSILRSTKTNRQVWVPVKVGLNIRKVNLEVGLEPEDEERMTDTIYPSGMLQNIGPVDISRRLFKRLSDSENARNGLLRVWDYGYDWRLSPALLSRQLTAFLEKLPSNQPGGDPAIGATGALVIPHSLGGLITRHVVNHKPELFSGVIYTGVPHSCINILGPIRNGDAVLLSSRVLTAQVNFTFRTTFVLLPEDSSCFFDIKTKEKYPVDFLNFDDWIKYRLSPCTDPPLPPRVPQTGGLGGLLNMSNSLLNLPIPGKKSISESSSPTSPNFDGDKDKSPPTKTTRAADIIRTAGNGHDPTLGMQMNNQTNLVSKGQSTSQSVSTLVTIPREKALVYLRRTLLETKKFKQELHFNPSLDSANRYPPLAVIYGKSIPTVFGAKVHGREGIPCADSYDNLAFASGDGVCLAKEAMLPTGYKAVSGGRISSDRGHVTLLGDLNAVGRAIEAVKKGRAKGIGLGVLNQDRGRVGHVVG